MNNHVARMAGLFSLALTLVVFSPPRAAADDDDPPGRVARLGYSHGAVSFQPGGTDEWVDARINRPMTTGDKLWVDAGALAEMNTGSAYIRVGSDTGFSFLNLSDYATQIQLTEGTLLVRLRRLDQNESFEIDTPNLAFSIYQAGTYKVTVNQTGDVTDVQVRQGQGEVTGGGAAYTLQAGDEGRFSGTDGLVADIGNYRQQSDNFENWSSQRDRRIDHSYSTKYVSPDVIGYEDLDENGGWRPSGEYGNVWFPHTTVVGWAPYHNGHWAYIAPWGYTWVDDEPWGFAPFHYGRWINVEGSWGWVPGPRESDGGGYVRPVYAPALVAWVGGAHFAIGVSVGSGNSEGESVGWFPLGPREVYVPSYPVSRTYVNNVNVSNTNVTNTVVNNYYNTTVVNNTNTTNNTNVNVTNVKYVNQAVPGAVTATTSRAFVSAQPVAKNIVQVNQREIASAPVRIAAPPVAPSKEAVLGTTVRASAKPPEAVVNRTVVAKAAPPPPPVPFAQQQKAIQANGGKPLPGAQIHQMQVQEQQQVQRTQQQQPQRAPSGQPTPAQQAQLPHPPAVRIAPPAQPQSARPAQAEANPGNRPVATPNNPPEKNNRPASQNTQEQAPPQQPNRPPQPATVPPNQPGNANAPQQQANRPEQPPNNNGNRVNPNNQANRPPNQPPPGGNAQPVNERPPAGRQPNTPDPALEQKHQQELEQLHKQQDQERQRVEQQQQQTRQAQAAAEQQRQQQLQAQKNAEQQQLAQKAQAQSAAEKQRLQQEQQRQQLQQQQLAAKNAEQQRQQLEQQHQQALKQLEEKHAQEQQQLNQKHEQEHQQQARPQPPPPPQEKSPRPPPPPPSPQKDKEKPKSDRPPPPPPALQRD